MGKASLLFAAILAGMGLPGQTAARAQNVTFAAYDPYLDESPGEACPPLVAPSPYATPPVASRPVAPHAPSYRAPTPPQSYQPPMPPQSNQAAMSPVMEELSHDPGWMPGPPIMQPLVMPTIPDTFLAGALYPQSIAPNMIGDFFGVSSGLRRSVATIQVDSFHFADSFRRPGGGLVYFDATGGGGTNINLGIPTTLQSVQIEGLVTTSIPQGSTMWSSQNAIAGPFPASFDLQENPDETAATTGAFPGSTATFVEGIASQNPQDPAQYSIFTDYLVAPGPIVTVVVPNPGAAPGAVVGRQKIADNASPIPRTRLFVNYSHTDNSPLTTGGLNVSQVTPGLEIAFLDHNASIEVRAPFASTLSSDINGAGVTSSSEIEFGNLTMFLKALMFESDTLSWSAGVGMTLPTADDLQIQFDNVNVVRIENEAIHLLPFLGLLWTPCERVFVQGFLQFDVDTNGNPVEVSSFNEGVPTGNLTRIGRADDSTYAFVDLGIGYWMYLNRCGDGLINGFAPTFELHYNAASEGADTVRTGNRPLGANVQLGIPGDLEVTNAVFGLNAIIGECGTLTISYATPAAGDDQFDGEFRIFFNWFFGSQTPGRNSLIRF